MSSPKNQPEAVAHALNVLRTPLALASPGMLDGLRAHLQQNGVAQAVANHDTGTIFNWLVPLLALQGISNSSAHAFAAKHREVQMVDLDQALAAKTTTCPRLMSYWSFNGCGHLIVADACSEPHHRRRCPVPNLPARNGRLAQAVVSLRLFVRDVCDDDLVAWIDQRLAEADLGGTAPHRGRLMRDAVLEPLTHVHGLADKVTSLFLADLLLGANPIRERWVAAGAKIVVIDTLVHNFLHRTGVLAAFSANHPYGPACYAAGGCADVVDQIAHGFDPRALNPTYPANFPRLITHAIWRFCSIDHWDVCNGNRIDDRAPCQVDFCPVLGCARVPLGGGAV